MQKKHKTISTSNQNPSRLLTCSLTWKKNSQKIKKLCTSRDKNSAYNLEPVNTKKLNLQVAKMKNNSTEIPRIYRWKQVSEIIPWSRSYTYALVRKGLFPKPIKLLKSGQAAGWWESDIQDYMNSLMSDSGGFEDEK